MGLLDFRCIFLDCQFWVAFFDDVDRVAGGEVLFFWSRLEVPGSLEVWETAGGLAVRRTWVVDIGEEER
jgi:hypothetical protein